MINFRVMVAGRQEPLFTEEALTLVYHQSKGMPRAICVLGLNILPAALIHKVPIVDVDLVAQVIEEMK
jgi:type II secretory pathway predicted ATPase ExeA